jgi:YD repeat-containing protein
MRTSTFDARNRLIETTGAGQSIETYSWNSRGQLTTATTGAQSTTYTFDGFERLIQTAKSGGATTTFTLRHASTARRSATVSTLRTPTCPTTR